MPPKTLEVVEIVLDLSSPAPGRRFVEEVEDEFFHGEYGLAFIEGGPNFRPVRWQPSEAEEVAVLGESAPPIRRIDVANKPQQPHQSEERIAGDPSGTKRPVKLEAGIRFEDRVGSRRQAELDVAVIGPNPDQRIEKRICARDVPVRPMFLNEHHLGKARVEISLGTLDLDAGGCPYNPAHAAMLF